MPVLLLLPQTLLVLAAAGLVAAGTTIAIGTAHRNLPEPAEDDASAAHHTSIAFWTDKFVKEWAQGTDPVAEGHKAPGPSMSKLARFSGLERCGIDQQNLPVPRDYLVVLPAGEGFNPSLWMDQPQLANWDLVILYYGSSPTNFSCPFCKAIYAASGAKWRLAYRFTLLPEWHQYRQLYRAIMVPDDDLQGFDTCMLNIMFSTFTAFNLLLAQPSLCTVEGSYTAHKPLYQDANNTLRYTNFVEIMGPVFAMSFFDGVVRHTLHNAYYGWGLDFVWGYLLRQAENTVAVLDAACMFHPKSGQEKQNSLYAVEAPFDKWEEMYRRLDEHGYTGNKEIRVLGFVPAAPKQTHELPVPSPSPSGPPQVFRLPLPTTHPPSPPKPMLDAPPFPSAYPPNLSAASLQLRSSFPSPLFVIICAVPVALMFTRLQRRGRAPATLRSGPAANES